MVRRRGVLRGEAALSGSETSALSPKPESFILSCRDKKESPAGRTLQCNDSLTLNEKRLNHSTPSSLICQSAHIFVTHAIVLAAAGNLFL